MTWGGARPLNLGKQFISKADPRSFDGEELLSEIRTEMIIKEREHINSLGLFTRFSEKVEYVKKLTQAVQDYAEAGEETKLHKRNKLIDKMDEGCFLGTGFNRILQKYLARLLPAVMELKNLKGESKRESKEEKDPIRMKR